MPALAVPSADVIAADVARALAEDLGPGDATAQLLPDVPAQAWVVAKEAGVIAGAPWFDACFRTLDPQVDIRWRVGDGDLSSTVGSEAWNSRDLKSRPH